MSEHTEEYRRGYEDGIESFRPKFEELKARIDPQSGCGGCVWEAGKGSAIAPCPICSRSHRDMFEAKGEEG